MLTKSGCRMTGALLDRARAGEVVCYDTEPGTSVWQRAGLGSCRCYRSNGCCTCRCVEPANLYNARSELPSCARTAAEYFVAD